jgi:uncharacterized membrane protein YkvA (DUF1232 family)
MRITDQLRNWAHSLKVDLLTLWFCQKHPDMPFVAKGLAIFLVAYAFSPIDLIPDFIPVLGYLDDMLIVPIGIYFTLRLIPAHVKEASRAKASEWQQQQSRRPNSWIAASFIVVVWIALAFAGWQLVVNRT